MRQVLCILLAGLAVYAPTLGAQTGGVRGAETAGVEHDRSSTGFLVVVDQDVREAWDFLYRHITEVEFVLCLKGEKQDSVIRIFGYRLARMEEATRYSVRYHPCENDNYVGTAHNHPPMSSTGPLCYHSAVDQRSFSLDTRAMIDVVLCGEGLFVWMLRDGSTGGPGARVRQAPDVPSSP